MSLFEDAARDYQEIHNDEIGALVECQITSPDGVSEYFSCRMSDISQTVDRNNRERTTGRMVSVSVSILDLKDVGFENIRGVAKKTEKPWIVSYENLLCVEETYKVAETAPDKGLGGILLHLAELK